MRLYLGRDFDVHSDPLGGKFDSVAILGSGEGLGTSGHFGKSPEVIWMSFPRFCCAFHNGRTELKTLYEKNPNDLEVAARQVLLPTNEVRHIKTVVTRNSNHIFC